MILLHPKEARTRIGTGRLVHLCVSNSRLIEGVDFRDNIEVNELISDSRYHCVVLYPSDQAIDISAGTPINLKTIAPDGKKLIIFVIDGTWASARKMLRISSNIAALPRVRFNPPHASAYLIRRQPRAYCYSTIEAVHFMIERFSGSSKEHDQLLDVFYDMVKTQQSFQLSVRERC